MKSIFLFSFSAILATSLPGAMASARELNVADSKVKKTEVRYGQIGPRDTLIFYSFEDQAAVLQLRIKREGEKFTLNGTMQLFAEGTDAGQIGKWVNNQHSCGLYPDVPEPTVVHPLEADACLVLDSDRRDGGKPVRSPMGEEFEDYVIEFKVEDVQSDQGFQLKGFTAKTGAFVKVAKTPADPGTALQAEPRASSNP